jgi:hypothetical protein
MALTDFGRMTEMANRAGVADRLAQITGRMAEQLSLAAEAQIAALVKGGVKLTDEQRTIAARAYAQAVRRLEGEAVEPIEGTARELTT